MDDQSLLAATVQPVIVGLSPPLPDDRTIEDVRSSFVVCVRNAMQ